MAEKPTTTEPDKNLSAKRLGRIGATLCGIVIFAILATTIWDFSIHPGDVGDAMGVGMLMVLFIPVASIPAFLFCLFGAVASANALREHPWPEGPIRFAPLSGGPDNDVNVLWRVLRANRVLRSLTIGRCSPASQPATHSSPATARIRRPPELSATTG